jgi:hypothetical protein
MSAGPPTPRQPEPDVAAEARISRTRGLLARAETAVANPILAYGSILVLQLRLIWNLWQYKDLTSGDTSGYFLLASSWAHGLHDDIVWAPLYTNLLGTIIAFVGDAYTAVMVHRIAIILAATLLVLALMRSLLGPALGLLATVWWTVLPPNFNVEYELHLFGLLPILVAALIVARAGVGRGTRGTALAILAGTSLLIRNELIIATAIVAVAVVIYEVRERREHKVPISAYATAYGVPLAIVCLLAGGAYWRSFDQGHDAQVRFRAKHDLNMCQVYAASYQQRYPSKFLGNPFTDCAPLMQRTFGRPMPSFFQETTTNPRAVAGFIAWNARLMVSGLQVALFGATATGDNPDYFSVKIHRAYALVLSVIVLTGMIAGLAVMAGERKFWRRLLAPNVWAFIVLGAVAITMLVVALTQRPRPEYMYGLTVGLIALAGLCTSALLRRLGGTQFIAALAVGLTVGLCVALSSYYHRGPMPLHDAVSRLQVIRGLLRQQGSVLVTSGYNTEICSYLGRAYDGYCTSPSWPTLRARVAPGRPIRDVLNEANATAIYADPLLQTDPVIMKLLTSPRSAGWRQVAAGTTPGDRWAVLIRAGKGGPGPTPSVSVGHSPALSALRRFPQDLADPGLEYAGIFADGWVEKDADVALAGGAPANLVVRAQVLSREGGQPQHLRVLVNGRTVASVSVRPGLLVLEVPVPALRSERRIELRWAGTNRIAPNDPRQAAALLRFLGLVLPGKR